MIEKEIREQADRALAMSEMFQERCHSAEDLLVELVYRPWWKFGERKKLRKGFEAHYKRFVSVSFNEYLKK